jgi:uncharacterized protein YggU (UPF0235/DUF167 family)
MEVEAAVTPGARKERVVRVAPGRYTISVREEAERNEANFRVREILADLYRVPVARVRMMRGARSRKKSFTIDAK